VPIIKPVDPVDREVNYMPTKAPYDPRWMLAGRQSLSMCNNYYEVYCFLYFHVENCLWCSAIVHRHILHFDFFTTSSNYVTFVLSFPFILLLVHMFTFLLKLGQLLAVSSW